MNVLNLQTKLNEISTNQDTLTLEYLDWQGKLIDILTDKICSSTSSLTPLHPFKPRYFKLVQLQNISSIASSPIEQRRRSRYLSFGHKRAISVIHQLVRHIHELRLRYCSFGENLAISIIGILVKPLLLSKMRKRISYTCCSNPK
ncbi:hypothetical protein Glove_34g12 [Diversispora epigaea]|uniref:Uncharacterized protein n=1 Tax=Diversispora epigaea TaxID=1348612 RepID=A0A397JKV6_9GLOM|nr:hypothetical protein Glove_34g12 [Diversispora epigaea]